ncbi:MAG: hypothetical protein ACYDFU_08015 [Nitrospirota bacterium]
MPFDIVVFDDNYKFIKELHLDTGVHGALWRKIVNPADYPNLGKAVDDKEDVIFAPEELQALTLEVERLEQYLMGEKMMSPEVKEKCLAFTGKLKEICLIAQTQNKSVDFVAGE